MQTQSYSQVLRRVGLPLLAVLLLGLAPYSPEPHIWKQIQNIKAGTLTQAMDFFDLLMHGAPWAWLIVATVREFTRIFAKNSGGTP